MAFDTEKPPTRVVIVMNRAAAGQVPEVRALFNTNPEAAEPYRDWLASRASWESFGYWFDSQPVGSYGREQELA